MKSYATPPEEDETTGGVSTFALPLGSQAHAIYSLMKANGHEELDFSSVYLLLNGHFNGKAEK